MQVLVCGGYTVSEVVSFFPHKVNLSQLVPQYPRGLMFTIMAVSKLTGIQPLYIMKPETEHLPA